MSKSITFKYFKPSPEVIRLAVMMYVRFPLSLRQVEDLLHERGIDVIYESVRYCGTGLARCLRARSESVGPRHDPTADGNGIWTGFSEDHRQDALSVASC